MRSLDTNIFLRYLTGDDGVKAANCFDLFQKLEREEEVAMTCEAIIAEIVFVLSSPRQYGLSHDEIAARLSPLLRAPGLRVDHKAVLLRALDIFAVHPGLDFEDTLLVAHMERLGITEVVSYDKDFDRIEGVQRREP